MFARRYVPVIVSIKADRIDTAQTHRFNAPFDERHDCAAERYIHYRHELGDYTGSSIADSPSPGVIDRFERGTIFVSD